MFDIVIGAQVEAGLAAVALGPRRIVQIIDHRHGADPLVRDGARHRRLPRAVFAQRVVGEMHPVRARPIDEPAGAVILVDKTAFAALGVMMKRTVHIGGRVDAVARARSSTQARLAKIESGPLRPCRNGRMWPSNLAP